MNSIVLKEAVDVTADIREVLSLALATWSRDTTWRVSDEWIATADTGRRIGRMKVTATFTVTATTEGNVFVEVAEKGRGRVHCVELIQPGADEVLAALADVDAPGVTR